MIRSGKLGTLLKSRLHQNLLSQEVVTRSRMRTENLPFLETVACQFSSLPIFVDCNKVRKHFEYILYAWMEAFQVCKCKSTADRTCDFTPLSARKVSHFSRSTLNEKLVFSRLIKVASLTIFCVPLPSYNFIVSIKDDIYCVLLHIFRCLINSFLWLFVKKNQGVGLRGAYLTLNLHYACLICIYSTGNFPTFFFFGFSVVL